MIAKLQKIQYHAARIVLRIKISEHLHMSPHLSELHWLPVHYRVLYKINLLSFKCVHNMAPSYLSKHIRIYAPVRTLRSKSQQLLVENKTKNTGKYGRRAFSNCAPDLWNKLPQSIRSCDNIDHFKSKLKTHYFRLAFA